MLGGRGETGRACLDAQSELRSGIADRAQAAQPRTLRRDRQTDTQEEGDAHPVTLPLRGL